MGYMDQRGGGTRRDAWHTNEWRKRRKRRMHIGDSHCPGSASDRQTDRQTETDGCMNEWIDGAQTPYGHGWTHTHGHRHTQTEARHSDK